MKLLTTLILFFIPLLLVGQTVLYEEHFTDGSLDNVWFAGFNGNVMEADSIPGNPSGDCWVGELGNNLSGGGVGESYSGDHNWTDFHYEAQVYINCDKGVYYGIEFRVDSTGNTSAYQLVAKPSASQLRFRSRVGASPSKIKDWETAEIPGGFPSSSGWHKMAAKADGNQFWLYFDDQELPGCPYTDDTFSKGAIGAYTWDMSDPTVILNIDDLKVTSLPTAIDDKKPQIANDFNLKQNYPNPFNPTTTIEIELKKTAALSLIIYNVRGKAIKTLLNGTLPIGSKKVKWDATDFSGNSVAAGIYYYTLKTERFSETKKMILLK